MLRCARPAPSTRRRWLVSRDGGTVMEDGVNLYAQWFVIYAATGYAKVCAPQGSVV